jgi:Uma2 family endonuclease
MIPLLKEEESYTYADYLEWDENVRAEIHDGAVYLMSSPTTAHQAISRNLMVAIATFLTGKPCKVFAGPFGVRLFPKKDNSDDTIVEPDITVVCDSSKLDEQGYNGAPSLIIEILSPSSIQNDSVYKFNKYLKAGVQEYWIIDPDLKSVVVHVLNDGRYISAAYTLEDGDTNAPITVLPGCAIDLKTVFEE